MLDLNQQWSPPRLHRLPLCSLEHLPASRLLPPSCANPATFAMRWIWSQTPWLGPSIHCTYYSRHPVIYFSSELIAKSIWSRGKNIKPKLAMKSRGTEKALHLSRCSLGRQGWRAGVGEMLSHLLCGRPELPSSVEGTWCSGPGFLLFFFLIFSAHPFRQKSKL